MNAIQGTAVVTNDHRLHLEIGVPPNILPGEHQVVVLINQLDASPPGDSLNDFPLIDVGPWLEDYSVRREELYDDAR